MWKYANVSVRGSAHTINGLPCQDATSIRVTGEDRNLVLCALSDGAGSAKHADEASHFLVTEVLRYFGGQLGDHPNPADLLLEYDRSDGHGFLIEARQGLQRMADERGVSIREFSATILFAAIHPKCSVFLQIGDGCWVGARNGVYGAITWPSQGEFVGQTDFVISANAEAAMQMETVEGMFDSIIGITDGLERLALDLQACVPSPRFFSPLLGALARSSADQNFHQGLVTFLESDRVCERTDDDKSLVLVNFDANGLR